MESIEVTSSCDPSGSVGTIIGFRLGRYSARRHEPSVLPLTDRTPSSALGDRNVAAREPRWPELALALKKCGSPRLGRGLPHPRGDAFSACGFGEHPGLGFPEAFEWGSIRCD